MSDSFYKRILRDYSRRSRLGKFELFQSVFEPRREDRILDVGADPQLFSHYTFEDFYPFQERITGGSIDFEMVRQARVRYPKAQYAIFDGRALPFPDKSFDIVFSNAVIEHIVGAERQRQFAREAMRVGKSWFITTPNYWFPLEVHYLLPCFQFLPPAMQRIYSHLSPSAVLKGNLIDLSLLSARDLGRYFPTSEIATMRVTFWPETLVAYYADPARKRPQP
ncbi:MAG: class I SAM-dependent methyltransferase [Acidobacteria bacterium]|nr:class I SAM-dependent methyltransferase [Acidobacteriota bacterium]